MEPPTQTYRGYQGMVFERPSNGISVGCCMSMHFLPTFCLPSAINDHLTFCICLNDVAKVYDVCTQGIRLFAFVDCTTGSRFRIEVKKQQASDIQSYAHRKPCSMLRSPNEDGVGVLTNLRQKGVTEVKQHAKVLYNVAQIFWYCMEAGGFFKRSPSQTTVCTEAPIANQPCTLQASADYTNKRALAVTSKRHQLL